MESVLLKANLVNLSTSQYWLIFNREKGMLDREGHGHKAVVYKSHFLRLRHSVVTETPADTLANKPHLTKDQALSSLCPHDKWDPPENNGFPCLNLRARGPSAGCSH